MIFYAPENITVVKVYHNYNKTTTKFPVRDLFALYISNVKRLISVDITQEGVIALHVDYGIKLNFKATGWLDVKLTKKVKLKKKGE